MITATNLGFPRIGADRQLKRALEAYWAGMIAQEDLCEVASQIRRDTWLFQQHAGLGHVPSNDFSLYDHVLDAVAMVGAVPSRYGWSGQTVDLDTYFAMARGRAGQGGQAGVAAMEMTKWFDTNYHYLVPEFEAGQSFRLASTKPIDEFVEAKRLGVHTRPVLVGPVSLLLLGKAKDPKVDKLALLDGLVDVYAEMLAGLADAGADWVQIDEPCLVLDLDERAKASLGRAYQRLAGVSPKLKLLIAAYFGDLRDNLATVLSLPVAAVHVDLVRAPGQIDDVLGRIPAGMALSVGVVDGRNIWKTDLAAVLATVEKTVKALGGDRVLVAPSCSLLHSPVDLDLETQLDDEFKSWLAFAKQKIAEIVTLTRAVNEGRSSVSQALADNAASMESRRTSPRIHNLQVKQRVAAIKPSMLERSNPFAKRQRTQRDALKLPAFPTTTIGSFPQTSEIRTARAALRKGEMDRTSYDEFLRQEIRRTVEFQERIGIDVLVHGEAERNDMVEYFGEQLEGFVRTTKAWVQSYGSRCVKPPIIFGDLSRPQPMTVEWSRYAQSLTHRPMKGMLTGPITILQWSFVRDDQPRSETCKQIALAIRDEVADLEAAGIRMIQIDEPAVREGLPLRRDDWDEYLRWAVDCFRLASSGVADTTQIHTHMCYSEFNDIIESIAAFDADVISIEASRSDMDLLDAFVRFRYPNQIGPGVYDIHSPRVPSSEEMTRLLGKALDVLSVDQIWVNPDCGLKTRQWEQVEPALTNMVAAARTMRERATAHTR